MLIFITGVAGFLGSHLADAMLNEGHQVVGIDTLIGGDLDNVNSMVEFHQVDRNDLERICRISQKCDIFYHCAATAYEGLSVFSPHIITYISSPRLLQFSRLHIQWREQDCFRPIDGAVRALPPPFKEEQEPNPEDPYGIGKLAAEKFLRNFCQTHGVEYAIAVPHNIIGPRQKYDDQYRNVGIDHENLNLQDRPPIIYGDGSQQHVSRLLRTACIV